MNAELVLRPPSTSSDVAQIVAISNLATPAQESRSQQGSSPQDGTPTGEPVAARRYSAPVEIYWRHGGINE